MKLNKQIILFLIILLICSFPVTLFSQNNPVKPTRQSALEAFTKGNYEQAYTEYNELLVTYSKDPLYKYYSGVCLVKMGKKASEAESLLQQSFNSAGVVKTIPADVLFYQGRAQQMLGKYEEATNSYNLFTEEVGKKTSKEYGVAELVQQCSQKKGKSEDPLIADVIVVKEVKKENLPSEIKPSENKETKVRSNVSGEFDNMLDEALEYQIKADSLNEIAASQKKQMEKLPPAEKSVAKTKTTEYEAAAASYQKLADQKFNEAQNSVKPETEKAKPEVIVQQSIVKETKDTTKKAVIITKPVETFSIFEVSAKPLTDPAIKIAIDPEVPAGLIYRIQIAVFRNPVAPAYFKGITPVYGFVVTGTDKTNYFAGMFRRSADAKKALTAVKAKGFKDAFVVALMNRKAVSADRAAILEKEWGKKPFVIKTEAVLQLPADTIPPTLAFRVEVLRSLKPVKEDVVDGFRKMAGVRGLDIQTLDDGKIAYLIGKFITFESAAEYADLLIRNGYRESKVVAWLGKKEIPVQTARQLFDKLE